MAISCTLLPVAMISLINLGTLHGHLLFFFSTERSGLSCNLNNCFIIWKRAVMET